MTQAWIEKDGSAGARQHCRDATLASLSQHVEIPLSGVAGRRHIGASALTSVGAPRADPCAGPTGETDSESSQVEGREGVFKYVSATIGLLIYKIFFCVM
jgi:hypothetical protein